jgi:hypothetical protein
MATYESLEQSLDELGVSMDRRLKRDAETIRELTAAARGIIEYADAPAMSAEEAGRRFDALRAALAKAEAVK